MKILLITVFMFSISCARKDNECRSRESMMIECQAVQTPQYGVRYAQEECKRSYSANKCY